MGNFQLNRTHKIIALVIVLLLLGCVGFVNWAGGRAAEYVKEKTSEQNFVQGDLRIADVGASFSGGVWITDITWHDPEGNLILKVPRVDIAVSFSDIFSGDLGGNSVKSIVLENPELHLVYDEKKGLNIVDLINEKEDKEDDKEKEKREVTFRGDLEMKNALLDIVSGKNKLAFENFDTKISYKDFPKVAGTFKAKQNKADFSGTLELAEEDLVLHVDGSAIALKDFFSMVPVESNLTVEEGNITKLTVDAKLLKDKPIQLQVEGDFEGIKAQTDGILFDSVKGNFNGNQNDLNFNNITGNFNEQAVSFNGKIDIKDELPKLDLKIASESFKINALSPGFGMDESLSFNAHITGTSENPKAQGDFSLPSLRTDQLELVNISGNFRYAGGSVNLDGSAGVYGGGVNANGVINLADKSFVFDINGSGLNSTSLTETKLHGPLSFNAHATGVGDPNAAAANGSFVIGKGDFNGIPFNSLTGDFSKVGSSMNFSNIIVNTLAGSIRTTAVIGTDGKVRFEQIDVNALSKEEIVDKAKSDLADKINEKTDSKLGDTLKKLF